MTFTGWEAIVAIVVFVLAGGAYIAWVLIGFNLDERKKGLPWEEF